MSRLHWMLLIVVMGAMLFVAACNDKGNAEVANQVNVSTNASPTSLGALPPDIQQAELAISNAQFDKNAVEFQENRPSMLLISNKDAVAYTFTIGGLVNETPLPPGQITTVQFTTPVAQVYEGQLLGQGSPTPVDTIEVRVVSAGNVSP